MSKTRNERRREKTERVLYLVGSVLMVLLLIASLAIMVSLWIQVNQTTRELRERGVTYPVISYLPEDFDDAAYQDALHRYHVENGLTVSHFIEEGGK